MFRLPAIGVSARTIGHATSSLSSEASLLIMRARSVMSMSAAAQQHLSFAASAPRGLPRQAVRSSHTLHDSVRGCATPLGVRLGPRSATHKPLAGFAGLALGRELDSLVFVEKGERFSFGGVQSQVPEVPYP
jgi:hypothetical protein